MKVTSMLLALSLLLIAPTIASANNDEARSDAAITARVKTALIRNDETKARQIKVETENGIVQLSGFVESDEMKSAAAATARNVSGVQEVRNELIVRQGGQRTAGRATDDAVIAAKVKSELATESSLATAANVNVEVRSGVVQLSGFVSSIEQKQEAEQIARQVAGVTDVRNSIAVELPR